MSASPGDVFGIATVEFDGRWRPAVRTERGVCALHNLLGGASPSSVRAMLLDDWDLWCDRIGAALAGAGSVQWVDPDSVSFAAPLPDPSNLYLAGANYYDHIEEMQVQAPDKAEDDPFHFLVPSGSLVGTHHDIRRPAGADQLDWEVELAVVIGRRADHVPAQTALQYVAGYAVANDVSIRGPHMFHPIFGLRFVWAKGQATLTPMGPVIVPARFVPEPGALTLSTHVNGELRQDSSTAKMVWSIEEQIAHLSTQAPLIPGDILLTGTPAGTAAAYDGAYLNDGDVLTTRVEGLGELVNTVVGSR